MKDMAQGVAAAATEAVDAVKETTDSTIEAFKETAQVTADAFHETVETVKGAAENTVASAKDFFDLRRHPWLLLASAVFLGYVLLTLTRPGRR